MSEREEKFERMLQAIQTEYQTTVAKMERLKQENKTKTARVPKLTPFVFLFALKQ